MSDLVSFVISSMLFVLGISYSIQPGAWARLARDAMENPFRYFTLILLILVLGLTVIATHNIWVADWPVVVTLIGWIMTVKAILFLVVPGFVKPFSGWSDSFMRTYTRVGGIVMMIITAPLVYRHLFGG